MTSSTYWNVAQTTLVADGVGEIMWLLSGSVVIGALAGWIVFKTMQNSARTLTIESTQSEFARMMASAGEDRRDATEAQVKAKEAELRLHEAESQLEVAPSRAEVQLLQMGLTVDVFLLQGWAMKALVSRRKSSGAAMTNDEKSLAQLLGVDLRGISKKDDKGLGDAADQRLAEAASIQQQMIALQQQGVRDLSQMELRDPVEPAEEVAS